MTPEKIDVAAVRGRLAVNNIEGTLPEALFQKQSKGFFLFLTSHKLFLIS